MSGEKNIIYKYKSDVKEHSNLKFINHPENFEPIDEVNEEQISKILDYINSLRKRKKNMGK